MAAQESSGLASLLLTNNILLVLSEHVDDKELLRNFCGRVVRLEEFNSPEAPPSFPHRVVYVCGDVDLLRNSPIHQHARKIFVIRDLSSNCPRDLPRHWNFVEAGRVPLLVHGAGVYYRRFFSSHSDFFNQLRSEHEFQALTESTKPGTAHREGLYLTTVRPAEDGHHFHLLRCSTNLSGPTDNFRATDRHIVDALNTEAATIFQNQAPLNHVLAQIYWNTPKSEGQKQTKAKISPHADKTKDMPENGIMAFCTFYDQLGKLRPMKDHKYDYGYQGRRGSVKGSGLTRLRFRLKDVVAKREGCNLEKMFDITLFPNSVFFMPLSTNRLYTHEIRPAALDCTHLPVRLGYVVRCSSTRAVHRDGVTYINVDGKFQKMEQPTPDGMKELRAMYAMENFSDEYIEYGHKFMFSMNQGDYKLPTYLPLDEFRVYRMPFPAERDMFEELQSGIKFEQFGSGRWVGIVVQQNADGGVPIVRTSTKYTTPAQRCTPAHLELAREIESMASLKYELNNAMVERYNDTYTSMGFHSDQAQDLLPGSDIAVYSCYKSSEEESMCARKLVVEAKDGSSTSEVPLRHNHVVVFSLDTNRRFRHKIVLDGEGKKGNEWLGVTIRTSNRHVQYRDGEGYWESGDKVRLASDEEKKEFYKLRGMENKQCDFHYPLMTYSISPSDGMAPL